MKRLIVVVGISGRQSSSVIEALLEYPDEWIIRGTTMDTTSMESQVSLLLRTQNVNENSHLGIYTAWCRDS